MRSTTRMTSRKPKPSAAPRRSVPARWTTRATRSRAPRAVATSARRMVAQVHRLRILITLPMDPSGSEREPSAAATAALRLDNRANLTVRTSTQAFRNRDEVLAAPTFQCHQCLRDPHHSALPSHTALLSCLPSPHLDCRPDPTSSRKLHPRRIDPLLTPAAETRRRIRKQRRLLHDRG